MSLKFFVASGIICLFYCLDSVYSHGRMMEPPNRSSLWRFEEFASHNPPLNYDDNQLFCGSKEVQYLVNGGRCGECGDAWNDTKPRANENGGMYGGGLIVRNYTQGQNISSSSDVEEQSCFDQNRLPMREDGGHGDGQFHYELPVDNTLGHVNLTATLPADLTCEHCSLLWYCKTGNSWGECEDGTEAIGCGPQEEFRSCSDIAILPF